MGSYECRRTQLGMWGDAGVSELRISRVRTNLRGPRYPSTLKYHGSSSTMVNHYGQHFLHSADTRSLPSSGLPSSERSCAKPCSSGISAISSGQREWVL